MAAMGGSPQVVNGEAQANGRGGLGEANLAGQGEQLVAVAEDGGGCGDGVPEDIAEAAERGHGEVGGWGAIWSQSASAARAGSVPRSSRRAPDCLILAEVEDREGEGGTGCERFWRGDDRLLRVAGVIRIRGDGGLGEGDG